MATPNPATPDDTWDMTQTSAPPDAAPPSAPPSAAPSSSAADAPIDYGAIARQLMQQPTLPQVDTTPVKRGFLSLLGEAIAGGPETDVMSPAQRERAGLRALGDFGTSLMAGSGYYPGKPMFGGLAEGFQGAQRSERGSEQQSVAYLGAQQQYQLEQQQAYLARLKEALPYLTLDQQSRQAAAARALAGGGGVAVPGTASGAGGGTYESSIGGIEGSGTNQGAAGYGQFRDSTWQDFAAANPDLFKGMTPQQILDARLGPNGQALGAKAITWLAQRNAGVLGSSNIAPTGQSLGIAHYVGPGPAAKIMAAPDNAPVSGFVSPEALQLNKELQTMTVGQMKQRYAGVPAPGFLKPAGGAQPPAPYQVSTAGNTVPAPPGGSGGSDTPWDLPGAGAAATPPPAATDTTTPPPTTAPVTQPPAPSPYPPIKAGDVTISHPGEFADYRAKQFVPPTGEDFNPNLTPEQQAAFATKAQQLQLAQQQVSTLPFAEQPKALIEVKAKQAELAAAQQDAIQAKQQAAAAATTKYNETQQKDIQTRYDAAALAYNTAAQAQLANQNETGKLQLQAKLKAQENEQTSQLASRAKVLDKLDADADAAHENLTQLQLVKQLSDAAGQPGILASYPELRSWLVKTGIATDAQAQQWSAQEALTAASNKLTLAQRAGSGFSRTTNMDLQFLKNSSPQGPMPQDWRDAQTGYLMSLYQRQQKFAGLVHQYVADKMPLTDAQNKADAELGPTIPQVPAILNGQPLDKIGQARWNFDNLEPGQFYKDQTGNLRIFKPGNATRP